MMLNPIRPFGEYAETLKLEHLIYVGRHADDPETALLVSPGGLPFTLEIMDTATTELMGWKQGKPSICLRALKIEVSFGRNDTEMTAISDQTAIVGMMHIENEDLAFTGHKERTLHLIRRMADAIEPTPVALGRGTMEQLTQVSAPIPRRTKPKARRSNPTSRRASNGSQPAYSAGSSRPAACQP